MEIAVKILKIGIMQQLQKVSLVQLYAVCSRDEPFWLIQEYISHGCLVNYLRTHEGKQLQKCDLEYIAYQIALGMKYLEAKNYIHRDLDARNILIGKRNFTTISFGLAQEYFREQGTLLHVKWTAPEDILYGQCSTKADVCSYGIVLMEIFTYGEDPYPGMSDDEVLTKIENGYRMDRPKNTASKFYNLMQKCWNLDPDERPTFQSMVSLEFMKDSDRSKR